MNHIRFHFLISFLNESKIVKIWGGKRQINEWFDISMKKKLTVLFIMFEYILFVLVLSQTLHRKDLKNSGQRWRRKEWRKKADKNPVDPPLFCSVVLFSSHVEKSLFSTSGSVVQVFLTNALAIVGIVNDSSYIQKCSLIFVHSFLGFLDWTMFFHRLREKINLDANNKLWNFVTSVHL